jgi:16S rRNA G966 N2-methylase RsmD
VFRFLGNSSGAGFDIAGASGAGYDIAFADPPYAFEDWPRLLDAVPARLVAIEARTHVALPEGWHPLRSKRYGDTVVTLARRQAPAPQEEQG